MPLDVNPKKWAQDIAEGMRTINIVMLKKYNINELRQMIAALQTTLKEIRSTIVPEGDYPALKAKNMKMTKVNQAITIINAFVKKQRLRL